MIEVENKMLDKDHNMMKIMVVEVILKEWKMNNHMQQMILWKIKEEHLVIKILIN